MGGGLLVGLEAPGRTSEDEEALRSVDREDSMAGLCLVERMGYQQGTIGLD